MSPPPDELPVSEWQAARVCRTHGLRSEGRLWLGRGHESCSY